MKKFITFISMLSVVVCCFFLTACKTDSPITADENTVIISANDSEFNYENKTLKDYMEYLQNKGHFTYTVNSGMVTAINGKANDTLKNTYWMLYTSDADNSNTEWGSFDNDGDIYGSATLGYESLPVKENCVYIWAYQSL